MEAAAVSPRPLHHVMSLLVLVQSLHAAAQSAMPQLLKHSGHIWLLTCAPCTASWHLTHFLVHYVVCLLPIHMCHHTLKKPSAVGSQAGFCSATFLSSVHPNHYFDTVPRGTYMQGGSEGSVNICTITLVSATQLTVLCTDRVGFCQKHATHTHKVSTLCLHAIRKQQAWQDVQPFVTSGAAAGAAGGSARGGGGMIPAGAAAAERWRPAAMQLPASADSCPATPSSSAAWGTLHGDSSSQVLVSTSVGLQVGDIGV